MGPEGSPCTPLRPLREWYHIVHWTPWLRIKMLTLDISGPTRHFGWFSRWPPWKKTNGPIKSNIGILSSVLLTFMRRTSIFKTLNFISDIKNLIYGLNIKYSRWPPLWSTFLHIFVRKSFNDFFDNTIFSYMFVSLLILAALLVM